MSIRKKYANFSFAAEDLTAYDGALSTAHTKMSPLPEEDAAVVKHLAKIGNKSESFAREALSFAKQHSGLMPRDLDLLNLERTLDNRDTLRDRLAVAKHLVERLEAAIVLCGVDSYRDGLDIYNALKRGGTGQSVRDAVRQLGRTFKKAQLPEEEPAPANPTTPEPEGNNQP